VTFAPPGHYAKLVVVQSETMLCMSSAPTTVFDSGCSISGTSVLANLSDVTDCGPMSVQGAFGPSAQPTKRGLLTPLGLDAILLPDMGNQTLVSLSQFCDGGTSGQRNIGVFTHEGCRMFTLTSALPALQLLGESGHEVARGIVQEVSLTPPGGKLAGHKLFGSFFVRPRASGNRTPKPLSNGLAPEVLP
jgi:hypothetical protein